MRPSHTDKLPRSRHSLYIEFDVANNVFLLISLSEEIVVHVVCMFCGPRSELHIIIRTWNYVPTKIPQLTQPRILNQFFSPMVKDQGQQWA